MDKPIDNSDVSDMFPWNLDDPSLSALRQHARPAHYRKGITLYCPDLLTNDLVIVRDGLIRSYLVAPDGREYTIALFPAGSMLCEFILFTKSPLQTFGEVMRDTDAYRIDKAIVEEFILREPELGVRSIRAMSLKMRMLLGKIYSLAFEPMPERLEKTLVFLAQNYGCPTTDANWLSIEFSHEDLAKMTASSRSSVSEQIGAWSRSGLIRQNRRLILVDPTKFKSPAD